MAEPLLRVLGLRTPLLPAVDHRLRQHAGGREGHVRRLLPDGLVARADLLGAAARRPEGRRVAEVPARERRAGVPAGELTMAGARTPFPIPYGWFSIGSPEDFAAGAPRADRKSVV